MPHKHRQLKQYMNILNITRVKFSNVSLRWGKIEEIMEKIRIDFGNLQIYIKTLYFLWLFYIYIFLIHLIIILCSFASLSTILQLYFSSNHPCHLKIHLHSSRLLNFFLVFSLYIYHYFSDFVIWRLISYLS